MGPIRALTLLLLLLAPNAFAARLYQVEMIVLRQHEVPAISSRPAPENWADGAQAVAADNVRQPAMLNEAAKLQESGKYTVLLQRAWQQSLDEQPSKIRVSDGEAHFGHYPIEGSVTLSTARFTDVLADLWVNQLDRNGLISATERLRQTSRMKPGELNFIDGGHLAALIKVTPL